MKTRKQKKGFTIVELVIVLAVVGVLAAILIPTFTNIINKANVAADNALVRELNNALALDLAETGKTKHETMTDALKATNDYGFDVSKISTKASKNKILWDSKNGVFCYLKDNATKVDYVPASVKEGDELPANDYHLWIISNTVDANYSTYLYNYTVNEDTKSFTFKHGLDVGETQGLDTLTYVGAGETQDEVVVYTKSASTTLVVDGYVSSTNPKDGDVVKHYGEAGALNIIKCADGSYHENGKVAFAEIAKGRIVLESGSEIKHIHVNAKEDDSGNSLNEFDTIIIADNGAKVLPEAITRDQVDVSEAKPVVTVESGSTSETVYVYPYTDSESTKTGTTEQTETQNTSVVSALGQLVLDNGSDAGEKAMSNNEKTEAKTELVDEAKAIELEEKQAACVHEFDDDGVCTKCGYQEYHYECRIGDVYYEELKDAIEALTTNETIVLVNNIETMSPMATSTAGAIPFRFDDKTVNIDLNGYTLQLPNSYVTMWGNGSNTANLNILDTSEGQNGKFLFGEASWGHIYNMKLTVYGGYYNIDVNDYISLEYEVNKTANGLYKVEPSVVVENTLGQNNDGDYLVYNLQDLTLVSKLVKQGVEDFDEKTIKLMSSIDLSDVYWNKIGVSSGRTFKGTFDGNGKTITLGNNINLFGYLDHSTIKNLNVFFNNSNNSHIAYSTDTGTVFENVDVSGVIHFASGNQAAYVVYPCGDSLNFVDCDSTLTIVGTGDASVYIALYMGYPRANMTIQFNNCINNGSISSGRAALYMANCSYGIDVYLVLNNCKNNGVVQYFADISSVASTLSAQAATPNYYYAMPSDRPGTLKSVTIDGTEYTNWGSLAASDHPGTGSLLSYQSSENLSITLNSDNTFTITPSNNENVAYYTITVGTYLAVPNGSSRYYVSETLTIDETSAVSSIKNIQFVDSEWKETHSSALLVEPICGNKVYSLNDTLYYYLDYEGGYFSDHLPHNPEMITVSGYSSEGILLCAASYK